MANFFREIADQGCPHWERNRGSQENEKRKDKNGYRDSEQAQPGRSHGDKFLVEGKSTEGGDRGDQAGHGKRQHQKRGHEIDDNFKNGQEAHAVGDQ